MGGNGKMSGFKSGASGRHLRVPDFQAARTEKPHGNGFNLLSDM